MRYTIEQDGFRWEIADHNGSGRWLLRVQHRSDWLRVASYNGPGAAALAVASGDTGITEWDDHARVPGSFTLDRWQAADGASRGR